MKRFRLIAAVLALFLSLAGVAYATCSYCGSSSYGSCPYAKVHKHTDYGADKRSVLCVRLFSWSRQAFPSPKILSIL